MCYFCLWLTFRNNERRVAGIRKDPGGCVWPWICPALFCLWRWNMREKPLCESFVPGEHDEEIARTWGTVETWKVYDWLKRSYHEKNLTEIAQKLKYAGRGLRACELLIADYVQDELPDLGHTVFNYLMDKIIRTRIDFERIARGFYGSEHLLVCSNCSYVKWSKSWIRESERYWEECPECKGRMVVPRHKLQPEQLVKSGVARDLIAANRILSWLAAKGYLPFQMDELHLDEVGN